MQDNLFRPVEDIAASVFGGVASFFGFGRDGITEPPSDGRVRLPDDLFAQPGVQTEWWYYTGHCETETGRRFGFELVFFKRRTDRDRLGGVPLMALANPMYFAHFAISDIDDRRFRYEHIRSFGLPLDVPVSMSETACDIRLGEWSLREVAGKHILHATLAGGFVFDAVLESAKPVVLNGDGGITRKNAGASKHFSYTRMSVAGQTLDDGVIETFTGAAWMDREFGSWEQGNWDWFSIQFDDETELMIYRFATGSSGLDGGSTGTFVDRDGKCQYLERKDFEIEVLSTWTSGKTRAEYPSRWRVRVPVLDIAVEIVTLIDDQELDTRGTTMIVYWEGACSVAGTRAGNPISGRAYVELVGYDRSHENMDIATFLFTDPIRRIRKMFRILESFPGSTLH